MKDKVTGVIYKSKPKCNKYRRRQ